jgi:2-polyprenyl-3-methyl-5-hydroxy-6-metoxy-1,4-benzoquinol methylase
VDKIFNYLQAPKAFDKGNVEYWTYPLFSDLILQGHLDQSNSGGSRKYKFMDKSVGFIGQIAPKERYKKVIDLGCGPGLYCERLANIGYEVTGLDISEKSIKFAEDKAKQENLNIKYRLESFLEFNETEKYDLALLIYYLYGSISSNERKDLLERIYRSLNPEGVLIMDVTSEINFNKFKEEQTWSFSNSQASLSSDSYIGFRQALKYPDQVTLEKTTLLFKDMDQVTFNIWNKSFSKNTLIQEVESVGFKVKGIYSDVSGQNFSENSEEIAILLEK